MTPIKFNTTRGLLILFIAFYVPHFALGKSTENGFEDRISQKWEFVTTRLGNAIDHRNFQIKPLSLELKKNHIYIYANTKKKTTFKGRWEYDESENELLLLKEGNKSPVQFKVIKCNRNELVLQGKDINILFVAPEKGTSISKFFNKTRGVLGIIVLIFLAFLLSSNKKKIIWRIPIMGLLLQLTFAICVLKVGFIRTVFEGISSFFVTLLDFTREGSLFLFGGLVNNVDSFGYIFAFQVLPTIIFFSALTSVLYYYGILQKIVYVFAWGMSKIMRLSGAESLSAAANIFIGQTEAPLVVKPYIPKMTKSEIMALMTGGMATIAGGVLAAYIGFLGGTDPAQQKIFAMHLLTASIMNAPASLYLAKILVPETNEVEKQLNISRETIGSNILDALAKGTTDGLRLAVNVGAMLLVFTAMMALLNYIVFHWIGAPTGLNEIIQVASGGQYDGLNMQYILGMLFAPIAWLIGIPGTDLVMVGQLLGEKTILNEFYAYASMSGLKESFLLTNEKSIIIATYALCGFANFASIGIQIGGIGAIAPNQRTTLSQLGLKALIGGTIASLITASIAGMII